MAGCSCNNNTSFDGASKPFKRAMWLVIAINGVMFLIEMIGGFLAESQALKADALDFLGDTVTYSITLMVIGMPLVWRAWAALFKGVSLGCMGLWVFGSTLYHAVYLGSPQAETMGLIGVMALTANLTSVWLLFRFRNGDANVRSVWLCSRNDAIGNLAVIVAASGVWVTNSAYPDIFVAGIMSALFLWSSYQIIRQSLNELSDRSPPGCVQE